MQSAGGTGAAWGGALSGMGEIGSLQAATKGSNAMEHRNLDTAWVRSGRGPRAGGYLVLAGEVLAAAGLVAAAVGLAVPSPFGSTKK